MSVWRLPLLVSHKQGQSIQFVVVPQNKPQNIPLGLYFEAYKNLIVPYYLISVTLPR